MARFSTLVRLVLTAALFVPAQSIHLQVDSIASIKSAASIIASDLVSLYHDNSSGQVPGLLPSPTYYWWEGGTFFDTLIHYSSLTSDTQYDSLVTDAIPFQSGDNGDFMPANQTKSEGNDDQSIWALAALSAVESSSFPFPSNIKSSTWLSYADAVFNDLVARWDTSTCNGGLRWQIFAFNTGYNYKNSASNGGFFQLAARLAHHTSSNTTYSTWADKIWTWSTTTGFIDNTTYAVYDGANTSGNCTNINHIQFSYVAGDYISGAAHMYNTTTGSAQATWKTALDNLLNASLTTFFPSAGVLVEVACESQSPPTCTTDMKALKAIYVHALVDTIRVAPYTAGVIIPKLSTSAVAAAAACNGGKSGTLCQELWGDKAAAANSSAVAEVGQQLSALSVVQALLVNVSEGGNETSSSGSGSGSQTSSSSSSASKTSGTSTAAKSSGTGNSGVVIAPGGNMLLTFGMVGGMLTYAW